MNRSAPSTPTEAAAAGGADSGPNYGFERAQADAASNALPGYDGWRSALERQYTVMPVWYWDKSICRRNYAEYIRYCLTWQRQQARINGDITGFHRKLGAIAGD